MIRSLVVGLFVIGVTASVHGATVDEAKQYCVTANEALREQKNIIGLASWAQSSNITDANDAAYVSH